MSDTTSSTDVETTEPLSSLQIKLLDLKQKAKPFVKPVLATAGAVALTVAAYSFGYSKALDDMDEIEIDLDESDVVEADIDTETDSAE